MKTKLSLNSREIKNAGSTYSSLNCSVTLLIALQFVKSFMQYAGVNVN